MPSLDFICALLKANQITEGICDDTQISCCQDFDVFFRKPQPEEFAPLFLLKHSITYFLLKGGQVKPSRVAFLFLKKDQTPMILFVEHTSVNQEVYGEH